MRMRPLVRLVSLALLIAGVYGGVGGKPLSIDTGDYGYQVPRAIARIRAGRPGRLQTCCSHPGQCVDRVGSNVELNSLASS